MIIILKIFNEVELSFFEFWEVGGSKLPLLKCTVNYLTNVIHYDGMKSNIMMERGHWTLRSE